MIYYLYRHIRLDTNEVFYVGIGTKNNRKHKKLSGEYCRAYNKSNRNKEWKKVVATTDYEVEIIAESNSQDFIFEKEKEFINLYGRQDLDKGTLVNKSDGGDNVMNFNKNTLLKFKESKIGKNNPQWGRKGKLSPNFGKKGIKNHLYGKRQSKEHIEKRIAPLVGKTRDNFKGNKNYFYKSKIHCKKVCFKDKTWECAKDCAEENNFKITSFRYYLNKGTEGSKYEGYRYC